MEACTSWIWGSRELPVVGRINEVEGADAESNQSGEAR